MSDQLELFAPSRGLGIYRETIADIKPAVKLHRATDFDTPRAAAKKA